MGRPRSNQRQRAGKNSTSNCRISKSYNEKTSLAIVCPITSIQKRYPFEVEVTDKKLSGVILSDHVRSLDWKARNVKFIAKAKTAVVTEVQTKLLLLIGTK